MEFLPDMEKQVNEHMNEELKKPFTNEEVALALKQMRPTKVPSLDSMPSLFYHRY